MEVAELMEDKLILSSEEADDFLCAKELRKEYLVSADEFPVRIESLIGKTVGILFLDLLRRPPVYLKQAYDRIRRTNGAVFEIVLVSLGCLRINREQGRDLFRDQMTGMPWLAVPFHEEKWMRKLRWRYRETCDLAILDGKGRLLQNHYVLSETLAYGPAYYPFTDKRKEEIKRERIQIFKSKSLKALLEGSSRDYVISCDGHNTKVPISHLQGKIIGLYIFRGRDNDKDLLNSLKKKKFSSEFQIIFINACHMGGCTNKNTFCKILKQLPDDWLALPFKDDKIWTLACLFSSKGHLGIVGADGDLFLYGFEVIQAYGLNAYPFTLDAAVHAEIERLRNLNLAQILSALEVETLVDIKEMETKSVSFPHDSSFSPVPVSSFLETNKRVVLVFDDLLENEGLSLLQNVHCKYESSLQVCFISIDTKVGMLYGQLCGIPMPCFACSLPNFKIQSLFATKMNVLFPGPGHVMAFEADGRLLKVGSLEYFGRQADHFPFITDQDFVEAVTTYLPYRKGWYSQVFL